MTNTNYEVWKTKALADRYLNGVRGAVPLAGEQFDVILRLIRANGRQVGSFLDLGSGDGILSSVILGAYPEAKGTLLDISEHMIEAAREKLVDYRNGLEFVTYDYSDKTWTEQVKEKSPFDVIVSGLSIHHQADQRKKEIYREIYDLLSEGGIFLNLEHVSSPTDWVGKLFSECFIDSLYEWNRKKNTDVTREKIADEMYHRPDKEANILAPVEEQTEWLRQIGYRDVDCYFKIYELAIFGGRKR